MNKVTKREIKITWWKKPDLDGYVIQVPVDASDWEITKAVGDFMEFELDETWEWEPGDFIEEDVE